MRKLILSFWVAVLLLNCIRVFSQESKEVTPSGKDLIDGILRLLPSEAVSLTGNLVVRDKSGVIQRLNIVVDAQWRNTSVKITCKVSDTEDNFLEQLTIEKKGNVQPEIIHHTGKNSSSDKNLLLCSIGKTDLSWMDVSMSFLWWPHAEVLKEDKLKGRDCYVVSLKPPEYFAEYYSHVLLWIDKETGMFIQAEYYDKNGERLRKMWVKSIKKINGKWFAKDIEAETYPSLTRTAFLVRSLKVGGIETVEDNEE